MFNAESKCGQAEDWWGLYWIKTASDYRAWGLNSIKVFAADKPLVSQDIIAKPASLGVPCLDEK